MVPEAKLENGVPQTAGWFVVNARDARWAHNEMGHYCGFEGKGEAAFDLDDRTCDAELTAFLSMLTAKQLVMVDN